MNKKYPIRESANDPNSLCGAINKINPDAAICVHHNSACPSARGLKIYYQNRKPDDMKQKSKRLADLLYEKCRPIYSPDKNRGVKPDTVYDIGYGILTANTPTVLFETDFLSNKDSFDKIIDPNQQDRMANAMAQAISEFVGIKQDNNNNNKEELLRTYLEKHKKYEDACEQFSNWKKSIKLDLVDPCFNLKRDIEDFNINAANMNSLKDRVSKYSKLVDRCLTEMDEVVAVELQLEEVKHNINDYQSYDEAKICAKKLQQSILDSVK